MSLANPSTNLGPIAFDKRKCPFTASRQHSMSNRPPLRCFETGVKVVDLIQPFFERRKDRPLRWCRRGQDRRHHGADQQRCPNSTADFRCSPAWVERTREGNDLWLENDRVRSNQTWQTRRSPKPRLIYGQMTEPPGARLRVALTALTVAEYFRD